MAPSGITERSTSRRLRSLQMSKVRSKDTAPEMAVRKLVFSLGYRYRLHVKTIRGRPDLVFPSQRKVIFVHGCFWHRHRDCKKATTPASNTDYWIPKFTRTVQRDKETLAILAAQGWKSLIVWECELKHINNVVKKLKAFLKSRPSPRASSKVHST